MLPAAGTLNNEQQEFTLLITKVVENSRSLIQDLMDLSALENNEMEIDREQVDINQILENCLSTHIAQSKQKNITFGIEGKANTSNVLSDCRHIERILQNLVSNALKFSHPGTQITIGAKSLADSVQFWVTDQGPGITEEDKQHLFKKFRKLSARPTQGESSNGLGLSIVKALITELGGTITVDSKAAAGTTFTCSLPVQ
jgi:signal transduction histidine kinase